MTMETEPPPECKGDNADMCDDIASWDCYESEVHHDCCTTCTDYKLNPIVLGCEYGNHQDKCNVSDGLQCYDNDIRENCCKTCQAHETSNPDCRYGDKITDCQKSRCQGYTRQRRSKCCLTCVDGVTTTTLSTHLTSNVTSSTIVSTVTVPVSSVSTVSSASSGMTEWFIPVAAAGVGGLVVLLVLIIVILLYRRSRRSLDHLSPIDAKMYNNYKLSKRPPLAPPRHPSTERDWIQERWSTDYAYINPKDVTDTESNTKRAAHDPLSLAPVEYLDLNDPVKYDYAENPRGINNNGASNNKHVTTNTYETFPGC